MLLARAHRPVPLYWTTFLVLGLSSSLLGPALAELRDRTGSGIGSSGGLFAAQAAGYIVGSFVGGRLYDRLSGHHVFGGSLVVMALGLAAVPSLGQLLSLGVAFFVVGMGGSALDVGANALLMWELGGDNSRSMNILHLCFGLGALSAPLFVYLGLNVTVRLAALTCVVLAIWAITIPPPIVRPLTDEQEEHQQTWRLLMLLATFFFLYVGLEVGFAGWIFTYAGEIDFSDAGATWLTTTFWIGFTVGRVAASALGGRVRPKVVMIAACLLTVVAAVGLVVGDGRPAPVWVGTALFGLATAPQFPVMLSYLERRIHVTGYATSWFIGAAGFGGLTFPWLIGRWFDTSGATALPWAMVVLGTLTVGSFAASNKRLGG